MMNLTRMFSGSMCNHIWPPCGSPQWQGRKMIVCFFLCFVPVLVASQGQSQFFPWLHHFFFLIKFLCMVYCPSLEVPALRFLPLDNKDFTRSTISISGTLFHVLNISDHLSSLEVTYLLFSHSKCQPVIRNCGTKEKLLCLESGELD